MEIKQAFDLLITIVALSILLWLFIYPVKDIFLKASAKRKGVHNAILILLCLIYIGKVIVKDLMPIL